MVIRAITEPAAPRPVVIEILEVDLSGRDRVLRVTTSSRVAARIVRDWLDARGSADPPGRNGSSGRDGGVMER